MLQTESLFKGQVCFWFWFALGEWISRPTPSDSHKIAKSFHWCQEGARIHVLLRAKDHIPHYPMNYCLEFRAYCSLLTRFIRGLSLQSYFPSSGHTVRQQASFRQAEGSVSFLPYIKRFTLFRFFWSWQRSQNARLMVLKLEWQTLSVKHQFQEDWNVMNIPVRKHVISKQWRDLKDLEPHPWSSHILAKGMMLREGIISDAYQVTF